MASISGREEREIEAANSSGDTPNTKYPGRGLLLIIGGEKDHTVAWAIADAACRRQRRNRGVTGIVRMPDRGHCVTVGRGWPGAAGTALDFTGRFA